MVLDMNLKFYTSVAKGLKLKFRKFSWLIATFVAVTEEKLVGERVVFSFLPPLPPILNMIKSLG